MRRLGHDNRGSIATMFALVAIPLIALAGLGTEAGMWYTTKRQAQNAADASAIAGAITLLAASGDASAAAKNVATANGFCSPDPNNKNHSTGCSAIPGASQVVNITPTASSVKADVTQTQPTLLAKVLALNSVTIHATATASIISSQPVCMLALKSNDSVQHPALELNGNQTFNATNCSLMSDGHIKLSSSPGLSGVTTLYAAEGCKGPSCSTAGAPSNWYAPPPTNPLATTLANYSPPVLPGPFTISGSGTVPVSVTVSTPNGHPSSITCPGSTCPSNNTLSAGNYDSVTISSGTLSLGSGTYKINSVSVSGGTLSFSNGTYNIGALTASATLSLNGSGTYNIGTLTAPTGATLTLDTGTYNINSASVSGGTLVFSGSGTYNISTLTAPTAGTLTLSQGTYTIGTFNGPASGNFTLGTGTYKINALRLGAGTLAFNSGTYKIGGTVTVATGNSLALSSGSYIIDNISVSGGTLSFSGGTYTVGTLNFQSGTLTLATTGTYTVGTVTMGASGTLSLPAGTYNTITASSGSTTLSGSGANYALNTVTVTGGTLTLPTGTNKIQLVTVSGGTLKLQNGEYDLGTFSIANSSATVTDSCAQYQDSCTNHDQNGENILIQSSLSVSNNPHINLTANTNNTNIPGLDGVLFYSPQSGTLNFIGNSTSTYGGALYFPNADLVWGGNSQSTMKCTEVIASTIQFSGTTYIDATGCPTGIVPRARVVLLTN